MINYEELEIKRAYSNYPTGLKHYSTEKLFENSLFDIALVKYKLASLVKGQSDGTEDNTRHKTENKKTAREILRGFVFRLLYSDRYTQDSERAIDTITGRYIRLDEKEQTEHKKSTGRCQEET